MFHSTKCHDIFSRQSEGKHNTLDFAGAKSCAKGRQRPPLGPRRHCLVLCQLTHSFRIWLAPISFERSCYHGEIRGIPVFVSYALDQFSKKGSLELNIRNSEDPYCITETSRAMARNVDSILKAAFNLHSRQVS